MRWNISELMLSARRKFAPIWYGRNHPYRSQIEVINMAETQAYPLEVAEHCIATEAFSMSGKLDGGKCADFVIENKNKRNPRDSCATGKMFLGNRHFEPVCR